MDVGVKPADQVVLPHLTPMQHIVLSSLANHTLTSKQVISTTGFARRTVYTGLRRLQELQLIKERGSLHDARQAYHSITPAGERFLHDRGMLSSPRRVLVAAPTTGP